MNRIYELEARKRELERAFPNNRLVWGEGDLHAPLVLVGEAPGENEEALGRPFVGKAGKNLDAFLEKSGIRRESVYITNAVKLRPTAIGKSERLINRKPYEEEIFAFRSFLLAEIALIKPRYVATLGNVALGAVSGQKLTIGNVHGQVLPIDGFALYPMYHPASVIYNPKLREIYERDVCALGKLLNTHA